MAIRLPYKFMRYYGWLLIWLMATTISTASLVPLADTCQHPSPPVITGTAKSACRGEAVVLTATGCTGTVVWSTGDTGNEVTVQPQQTTKYTAICRSKPGCISCFAEVWQINVHTPNAPLVTSSTKLTCADERIVVTASRADGMVRWLRPDGTTLASGPTWTGKLSETTTFQAVCEQNGCVSNPSIPIAVQLASPTIPTVSVDKPTICLGQSVQLSASGCMGTVRWMDGETGFVRTIKPTQTTTYWARCQIGTCQSDTSSSVAVLVQSTGQPMAVRTTLTNGCPFQTADLSGAIVGQSGSGLHYEFKTSPSLLASSVQSPGAVPTGTYYIFGRNADGCYTEPAAVAVTIQPCQNAIAPCLSNPATVAIRLDSLNWVKGVVYLTAQLGGSAGQPAWHSDGGGLFTSEGVQARYLLSEVDQQRGRATFTLAVGDADESGPCAAVSTQRVVVAPSREMVGLSKKVSEPVWVTGADNQPLIELTYQFKAVNMGEHAVTNVKLSDNLEAAFSAAGASVRSVAVRSDSDFAVNTAYTGQGADTTLATVGTLPVGQQAVVWLTVRLDVSRATTLTFSNKASLEAIDANKQICRDRSTNGTDVDPDRNGNPTDNDEPTLFTLHSLRLQDDETVFIPEGFSPNNDGINDRFVVQRVPVGVTVQLEVYNRWGHLVYQSTAYKNDWDGTANQGLKTGGEGLPDGTYYYQIHLSDGREFIRFLTIAR